MELTEALRIAPDFTLALNARGFVLVLLHEWAAAIEDLDRRRSSTGTRTHRVQAAMKSRRRGWSGGGLEEIPAGGPLERVDK